MSKTSPSDAVEAADQTLAQASASLVRERQRIKQTQDQAAALSAAIASTDPDDVGTFADLVRERDTLRGLLEALAVREASAETAVRQAEVALRQARETAAAAELARLEAEILKADAACTAEAQAGEERLLLRVRQVGVLLNQWREIEVKRREAAGVEGTPIAQAFCGSEWAKVHETRVASRALTEIRENAAQPRVARSMFVG